ncbi:MAG: DUF362 domain-containing protein [Candidatus Latescibacteria bacterium]|nr:DUF362 domain-containing protein [Candidatus Latescibacterota bacterium]
MAPKKANSKADLLFADAAVESLEADKTLPAKFKRMLIKSKLPQKVKDKTVTVKMHLGGGIGYTTIHPVFVRILVDVIKDGGAKSIKIIDGKAQNGLARGYTQEVLGCPVVSCFGETGKYYYPEHIGFESLDEALFSGEAIDSDFFIDLAHIKGHGDCGFGGALKNIAMGTVPTETRRKIHRLEGGLTIDSEKCIYCLKCFKACPNEAIWKNDEKKEISFFFHNCTYCQHCVMICPEDAIAMEDRTFEDFSHGMAHVTAAFLKKFKPENLFFINFLTNITMYCDCWEFSSPSLVPDIGILAGTDIAAIETASLDMIKTENLLPNGLPKNRNTIGEGKHLFEKIHAKDPYLMIDFLKQYYPCTTDYEVKEIK